MLPEGSGLRILVERYRSEPVEADGEIEDLNKNMGMAEIRVGGIDLDGT